MAAKRPSAVASSASAMPGATTASEVFFDAAIDWNEFMMPNTVPNRPMNGPAEATVASTRRFDFEPLDLARDRDVEHLVDAGVQAAERARRLLERALPLAHRRDEQGGGAGVVRLVRQRRVKLLERLAGPEHLLETLHLVAELAKQPGLVENDRPAPERSEEQAEHHRLDDDVGGPEHRRGCSCPESRPRRLRQQDSWA